MNAFSKFIKQVRNDREWSMRKLAEVIEMNHATVSLAESEATDFPKKVLTRMSARVLNRAEKEQLVELMVKYVVEPVAAGKE